MEIKHAILQVSLDIVMRREGENALCRYLLDHNITAKDAADT